MLELFFNLIETEEGKSKFENIYSKYKNFLFNTAISVLNDYHDAEDALQNILFVIAKNIDKIDTDNENKLKSYLRVVVKNASIDLLRKRNRERFENIDNIQIEDCEMLSKIDNWDVCENIISEVLSMPDDYRAVLVLSLVHNLTPKELSENLSIPLNTVYTRLRRGKKMLSKMIGDLYGKE